MIGTSMMDYLFIRSAIGLLRAVTPVCSLYCVYSVFNPPRCTTDWLLTSYAVVETAFYLLVYLPRHWYLQAPANHPPLLDREDRRNLFERCRESMGDAEAYFHKWFLYSKQDDIRRENVKDFYRWAILNTAERRIDDEEELEWYASQSEKSFGRTFEPGMGEAKSLRLTLDKVDMLHRPFIWYMIVGLVDIVAALNLYFRGFRHYRVPLSRFFVEFPFRFFTVLSNRSPTKEIPYWYRPHTSKTRLPVLFVHGIGIGLQTYVHFLGGINRREGATQSDDGEVGIIAVEIMPISFRITHSMPSKEELCAQINQILELHGWDKVVLASHSYGTVITTHLLRSKEVEPKIGPILLIDPVSILLHQPSVAFNFTARKPRHANEHQLYYLASKDMGVAHTLHRHFFWNDNILWKEDFANRRVTVSLAGRDLIVDTAAVRKYLEADAKDKPWSGHGLEVLWFAPCDHAQVFDGADSNEALVQVVKQYTKLGAAGTSEKGC